MKQNGQDNCYVARPDLLTCSLFGLGKIVKIVQIPPVVPDPQLLAGALRF